MTGADPIVGVDLGTSNTVVAYADGNAAPQVLADGSGIKIHPSVVSFHPSGGVVVGAPAKQRKVIDPKNTIFSVKRLIGRGFDSVEVRTAKERMPYVIKEGPNRLPLIATRGGEFAVPEISAIVLDHAKNVASAALGTGVSRAVVTVPASFNDAQRSATATAGSIAGLNVVRVLNEPTAAALAYGHAKDLRETIAVYDFGGGTFDVTILKLADQVYEVLGTAGNSFLGGDDLDERLVDRMVEKFLQENRVDLRTNEVSIMRLRAVAEQTKIELTRRSRAVVRIDEIAYGPKGKPLNLEIEIRREELVAQVADIIDRTFPVCQEALQLANLTIDGIDDVILVGGTTKVPYVREQVAKFFGKTPRTDINAEDAVAAGAALQGALLGSLLREPEPVKPLRATERAVSRGEHKDVFEERTPPPPPPSGASVLARVTKPGVPVGTGTKKLAAVAPRMPAQRPPAVPKSSPQSRTMMVEPAPRSATDTDVETSTSVSDLSITTTPGSTVVVDPTLDDTDFQNLETQQRFPDLDLGIDVSPAETLRDFAPQKTTAPMPAPLRPPTMAAPVAQPVVVDVTPRGLGIATVAGFCEELIRRNSRVPAEKKRTFVTSRDDQDSVRIIVVQGESRRLDNNTVIADLRLDSLPRRPRGETSIEVTFMLDASGILQVSARDAQTGREQRASLDIVGSIADGDVSASRDRVQALRR